jgi:hypothetical protein
MQEGEDFGIIRSSVKRADISSDNHYRRIIRGVLR